MSAQSDHLTHSLADALPGESLEVLQILFEESRKRCAEAGLAVGTRARCRERTAELIRLDLNDGRAAEIDGAVAHFIEVYVLEPGRPVDLPSSRESRDVHLS